jgi:tetratricopeptide (TPR) repeat protein
MNSQADSSPNAAQNAVGALVRIAVAAVILAGIYLAYRSYVENSKRIKELSKAAFELTLQDNPSAYDEAAGKLDEALAIRASDPFAVSARAEIDSVLWLEHGLADRQAAAEAAAARAVATGANIEHRFSAEALSLIAGGHVKEAESMLVGVIEKGAATAKVVAALGHVHRLEGKLETAKADFKQAADREWRSPRFATLHGETAFDGGDFVAAQNAFQKAADLNQNHLRSQVGRARADLAKAERVAEARSTLEDVLAKGAELSPVVKARALVGRAEALLTHEKWVDAEAAAREALQGAVKGDASGAYAQFVLGLSLAKQKKDGASDAIRAAIAAYPQVSRFYFKGALALAEAGKAAEGEPLFEEFKKANTPDDAYHMARGDFLRLAGRNDQAAAAYDEAIAATGKGIAEAHFKKGFLFQAQASAPRADKRKLFDQARKEYEKAVMTKEKYPDVYRQMGLIYVDLNPRSGEALENFGKALAYYREQRAPKATLDEFITEVEQRYLKAGLRNNAVAWRKEASELSR